MIKIISTFINNNYHIIVGILWIMIRHRILINFKADEINSLLNVKVKVGDIPIDKLEEYELFVKKYYLYHLIQYGFEGFILMMVLTPISLSIEISGGSLL